MLDIVKACTSINQVALKAFSIILYGNVNEVGVYKLNIYGIAIAMFEWIRKALF